ncbi:MAG: nuclease-related domain-containing protein [bacterium]
MVFEKGEVGRSSRQPAKKHYTARVFITLTSISAVALLIYLMPNMKGFGIAGMVVAGLVMKIIMNTPNRELETYERLERRAAKGAKAEEKIGDRLRELSNEYAVFHDIESPYGNVDHLVIDKQNNVFLVETKSHSGEVTYDGSMLLINKKPVEKDFIAQIFKNTFWIRAEIKKQASLDVFVKPVLVFTNAVVKIPGTVKNISIINKKYLMKILERPSRKSKSGQIDSRRPRLFTVVNRLQRKSSEE